MNLKRFSMFSTVSALVALAPMLSAAAAGAQSSQAEDVQVLTRGPVHEAFAEPVSFDPRPGLIVRAEPPKPIEELPPEQQLVGDNVAWIPGYWAWADERNDFIWVSGIWRNLPPGRQWIPGYWSAIGDGQYQWTSGYWADSASSEVSYLPAPPPRNIDVGPNVAASSDDQSWIPGNWVWSDSRYLWRPGYWLGLRPNWTWTPAHYCWTRRGYVYNDGYWDYAVANRGLLFAPLYFNRPIYDSPDYCYTPSVVIGLSVFADHLFVRPRCGQYYFGDYYASRYLDDGYYASCFWQSSYRGYDPIYAYDSWSHRGDSGWLGRRRGDYAFFRDHEDVRPQHTWAAMQQAGRNHYNDGRSRLFASSLASVANTPAEGQRFRALDQSRREQIVSQARGVGRFSQDRQQVETRGTVAGGATNKTAVARESLGRSPIVGSLPDRIASRDAPPTRPEARGPNIRTNPVTNAGPLTGVAGAGATHKLAGHQGSAAGRMNAAVAPAGIPQSSADRKTSLAGSTRDRSSSNAIRQLPGRDTAAATHSMHQAQVAPQLQSQPSARAQQAPQRQFQAAPQPRVLQAPQRQFQAAPQPRVLQAPQRQFQAAPQPRVQQAPQRQFQAAPQPRVLQAPQRQFQAAPQPRVLQAPQRQFQAAPQPRVQAAPQRQFQAAPQPRVQAAPQRQFQAAPQPRIQQAPQRQFQAAPQPRVQAASQSATAVGRDKKSDRSRN